MEKESVYISCLDANKSNWWTKKYLLKGGFRWLSDKSREFDIDKVLGNCNKGYVLGVDIGYPEKLHGLHNDYPLATKTFCVTKDMSSHYCFGILDKYQKSIYGDKKLIPNLDDKKNYIFHYANLKLNLNEVLY